MTQWGSNPGTLPPQSYVHPRIARECRISSTVRPLPEGISRKPLGSNGFDKPVWLIEIRRGARTLRVPHNSNLVVPEGPTA